MVNRFFIIYNFNINLAIKINYVLLKKLSLGENVSKNSHRNYFIFCSLFLVLSFFVLKSFVYGILWGAVIALSVWPLFQKLGNKNYALVFAIFFSLLFIIPLMYGVTQITDLYTISNKYIQENSVHGILKYPNWFNYIPMNSKIIEFWNSNISTSSNVIENINHLTSGKLFSLFTNIWSELLDRIITVIVMIVSFYFMIKNGDKVKNNYENMFSYWLSDKGLISIQNGISSLRGTINGIVLIGILEGVLLAIPLILGGLNSGFIIGLVAGLLGVIPMLMPLLIIPCLIYLFLNEQTIWAIIGSIDLFLVWILFENMIKPQMISKKVKINSFIILISMIGGMQLMGPVGLFLGPSIVSMGIGMLKDFTLINKENDLDLN